MNRPLLDACKKPSIVFCLCFSVLFGTSSVLSADPLNIKSGPQETFRQAETHYHAGKFEEARPLYQEYFNSNPRGKNSDRALIRLGQLDQRNGSFTTALRHYQILKDQFPRSSLLKATSHVDFLMAICHFELGQYPKAERYFRRVAARHPDIKYRWQALFHLGKIDERRFDFLNALDKLVRVYQQNDHQEVKQFAESEIQTLIDEKLSEENLISLAARYQSRFPGDLILLKLLAHSLSQKDIARFQSVANDFFTRFPGHPKRSAFEARLNDLGKNKNGKIRLGVVLPLTGKLAVTGQQVLQGIQLALNHQGFRAKEKVELVVRNSVAGGGSLTGILEELAMDPYMAGIIGPVLSGEVKAIVPIIEKYQIPVFSPTASSEGLPGMSPYIFRNALTRRIQSRYLAEYAINELHLNRFAILYPEESYGIEFSDLFKQEVESLGGEVITRVAYDRKQTDFKAQILELGGITDDKLDGLTRDNLFRKGEDPEFGRPGKLSRPVVDMGHWNNEDLENLKASLELSYDAIFIPGFFDKVGLIVPQLVFYNIDNVTLLGGNGWNSPKLVEIAGSYIKNGFFVDGFFTRSERPEVQRFVKDFKSTFGKEPSLYSAQSYDSANIMIKSILAGASNRIEVKKYLDSLKDYPGVSGKTTLLPSGDSSKELFTLKIKNRKVRQVN